MIYQSAKLIIFYIIFTFKMIKPQTNFIKSPLSTPNARSTSNSNIHSSNKKL